MTLTRIEVERFSIVSSSASTTWSCCGPVTMLIDERPDGVHLSYDRMVSLLGKYGDEGGTQRAAALAEVVSFMAAASTKE
jgi:hypothetical protein